MPRRQILLRANRLVGLRPLCEIIYNRPRSFRRSSRIVLRSSSRQRSQVAIAAFRLDSELLASLREGDSLNLVRTRTGDIGVSLLRGPQLVFAIGAVSVVSTGADVILRSVSSGRLRPRDHWLHVSIDGKESHVRGGQSALLGSYEISVFRCFTDGVPGTYECLAISHSGDCSHGSAKRSAKLLSKKRALRIVKFE